MEFSAKKSDILRELNLTQGVVEKKTTIPILSNLLLEATGETLRISATDLELGVRCGCLAKIKKEGSGTIPAKRLLEIIRSLPDAEVRFKVLENHWVQVTCERSSFKLVGMAKDSFPVLPAAPKSLASIPAAVFASMVERTIFAISSEESRYTLNGALLILKPESVTMVATDGHRLALVEQKAAVKGLSNELRLLIPKKAMAELGRLLAEGFVELDKEAVSAAIRRVALLADERSRAIRLQLEKGKLEIFSSSGEFGEAHEVLDAGYEGEPLQIGFDYQYLLDFLSVTGRADKIRAELKDEQSAGQFRPLGDNNFEYRYVVMPMRI